MTICATTTDFPSDALREAQAISVSTASFSDTAYYLFSRRTTGGKVGMPCAVYASSLVMKAASDYFCAQLDGGFSTNDKIVEDTEDYSYDDDSDIDEEDWSELADARNDEPASQVFGSSSTSLSDKGKGKVADAQDPADEDRFAAQAAADVAKGVKRRVFIPDIAATTWRALVHFLYAGKVYFAPLKSRGIEFRQLARQQQEARLPNGPPLCSPKSMYRLADIVGLNSLKSLAESAIKESLSERCIADEIFSRFSSTYTDILKAELHFIYKDGAFARVLERINGHIGAFAQGSFPHSETVLSLLLGKLSEFLVIQEAVPRPSTPSNEALLHIPVEFHVTPTQSPLDVAPTVVPLGRNAGEKHQSEANSFAGDVSLDTSRAFDATPPAHNRSTSWFLSVVNSTPNTLDGPSPASVSAQPPSTSYLPSTTAAPPCTASREQVVNTPNGLTCGTTAPSEQLDEGDVGQSLQRSYVKKKVKAKGKTGFGINRTNGFWE